MVCGGTYSSPSSYVDFSTNDWKFLSPKCWKYSYFLFAGLGKDHEILRRRIENGAKELWFFLQSELKKLKHLEGNELQRHADEILLDLGHHER